VDARRLGVLLFGVAGLATALTMLGRALYLAAAGGSCGQGCSVSDRAVGTLPISLTGVAIFVIVIVLSNWIGPRITFDRPPAGGDSPADGAAGPAAGRAEEPPS